MAKTNHRSSKKAGLPPGTLMYVGKQRDEKVKLSLIDYNPVQFQEKPIESVDKAFGFEKTDTVTWINIDGIHEVDTIEKLGQAYDLHPLILEDILNTTQRPKCDDYEQYFFVVIKMLTYDEASQTIQAEQVSMIISKNVVISFQERPGDVFEHIRDRIRTNKGRIRKEGADYLAYALIDAVVDYYFVILEKISDRVESLGEELSDDPDEKVLRQIHLLRRELIALRKSVWPLREVINGLQKSESKLIQKNTGIYLRDVYDHTIQVIDTIENLRDVISGMLDLYMSVISNKMNAVMKVLTIIATIFIPLTFIAGIYGMNFEFMPELRLRWAYPAVLVLMLAVAGGMIVYFKRKKWF